MQELYWRKYWYITNGLCRVCDTASLVVQVVGGKWTTNSERAIADYVYGFSHACDDLALGGAISSALELSVRFDVFRVISYEEYLP